MMEELEKSPIRVKLTLKPEREIPGELLLDGRESSLYTWVNEHSPAEFQNWQKGKTIKAVIDDPRKVSSLRYDKVSLVDCDVTEYGYCPSRGTFFFKYAVFGREHISHDEKKIIEVRFVVDDAAILFNDRNALNSLENTEFLVKDSGEGHLVFYHRGQIPIFKAETVLGCVSAWHDPACRLVLGSRAEMINKIFVKLRFENAVELRESVNRAFRVIRFLELMVGRPQNILEFRLYKKTEQEQNTEFQVYGTQFPKHKKPKEKLPDEGQQKKLPKCDILIDAVQNPKEFRLVLSNWLASYDSRNSARAWFFHCFNKQNFYPMERLVMAANMFDFLPDEAFLATNDMYSSTIKFAENLKSTCNDAKCRKILEKLLKILKNKESQNLNKLPLKEKFHLRTLPAVERIKDKTPKLLTVIIDEAVACRTYYVHNKQGSIDYEKNREVWIFLTDTLEFIFGVSDLIDAEWDAKAWSKYHHLEIRHPFGKYLQKYKENLEKLISLL